MTTEQPAPMGSCTDSLLTVEQLGEYLQVPLSTVYVWRKKKIGPRALKVGRHLRYRMADVNRWLDEQVAP